MSTPADKVPDVTTQPLMCYNWLCPYVHRVTLALGHKGAKVQEVDIDLGNKPAWLPKFSPHGKVPAITYLQDGEQQVLYESLVLQQWVDEYFKEGPALLPESPAQRAKARIIINRFDSNVVGPWYRALRAQEPSEFSPLLADIDKELTWLEDSSQLKNGAPFLFGQQPSLVDAAVAPWLLRGFVLKHWRNVDILAGHKLLSGWLQRYKNLPEVKATFRPPQGRDWDDAMNESYQKYAQVQLDFSALQGNSESGNTSTAAP